MADPATATSAPAAQSSPAAPADNNLDRVVCKTNAAPTGTRLGASHTCHTQREWDRERQEEQNHLTEMQIQRGNGPAGP